MSDTYLHKLEYTCSDIIIDLKQVLCISRISKEIKFYFRNNSFQIVTYNDEGNAQKEMYAIPGVNLNE